jgi:predicted CXXCH cytochrome family protein
MAATEAILVALMALAALVPLLRAPELRWRVVGATLLLTIVGSYAAATLLPRSPRAGGEGDPANAHRPRRSLDDGYVSSDACRACHAREYESWHHSYHRTMTQVITPETMIPEWNGTVTVRGEDYLLERQGDRFWVDMSDPGYGTAGRQDWRVLRGESSTGRVRRRVLVATGSHHQQVFWIRAGEDRELFLLPFTWMVQDQRWIPYDSSFLWPDPESEYTVVWNEQCIKCHATAGRPRLFPDNEDMDTSVAELGIACEACHGPGEEHVRANRSIARRYLTHLTGADDETIVNPEKLPPDRSNQVCGQCHSVMGYASERLNNEWWQTGFSYRPGDDLHQTRRLAVRPLGLPVADWLSPSEVQPGTELYDSFAWADGQVRNSGRDYNAVVTTACAQKGGMTCLSCHSMHESPPDDQLSAGMRGDSACLKCHETYAATPERHTHHDPESSGSRCYNCHSPYTTYGLFKAIRTHSFDRSPSVRESVEVGRPNACNLCHLDKSLGWTQAHLEDWYDEPPLELTPEEGERSAALLWLLRGDAGQRALAAWHMGWQPALKTSGDAWIAPFLAELLVDPYAAVRYIAARSLRRLPQPNEFAYDYVGELGQRAEARAAVRQRWRIDPSEELDPTAALFFDAAGELDDKALRDTLSRRDDRVVQIAE